jgi:hypothetical protein
LRALASHSSLHSFANRPTTRRNLSRWETPPVAAVVPDGDARIGVLPTTLVIATVPAETRDDDDKDLVVTEGTDDRDRKDDDEVATSAASVTD